MIRYFCLTAMVASVFRIIYLAVPPEIGGGIVPQELERWTKPWWEEFGLFLAFCPANVRERARPRAPARRGSEGGCA